MNDQRNGGIAWTDFTANPIKYRDANGKDVWACVKVSPGCAHCYSATTAKRFDRGTHYNAAEMAKLTPYLDEKELRTLLTSQKISGKRVFIGDMTDIFGEWVPFDLLDKLFAVFALRPDVTFQILTKRPERMRKYVATPGAHLSVHAGMMGSLMGKPNEDVWSWAAERLESGETWPLPNVWLGVSVENQETADQRIPVLLDTPASVRFVSYEPALGPVDFSRIDWTDHLRNHALKRAQTAPVQFADDLREIASEMSGATLNALTGGRNDGEDVVDGGARLDWIIVGGESGPGARPCDVAWIRSTVQQCKAAGVPVFVKQLGSQCRGFCEWEHHDECPPEILDEHGCNKTVGTGSDWQLRHAVDDAFWPCRPKLKDRKGGDPSEWPEDLRVREFPSLTPQTEGK